MSLMQEIGNLIGGGNLQRLAAGQGNFDDPSSQDHQAVQQMVRNANPSQAQQAFAQAAQQMDPQQYAAHVTPGVNGTNPLGALGQGGLATIASALVTHLMNSGGGGGGGGGDGMNAQSLLSRIPGLGTTDPNQMNANQVAQLAQYVQQNHPDVFGRAAAQVGQQQPALLNSFLGKAGLALGAAALASHFVKMG